MKKIDKIRTLVIITGVILQVLCLLGYIFANNTLFISIGVPIALILIVIGCFYIQSDKERRQNKIDYEDERNVLIRNKAHALTNNIMVYISLIAVVILIIMNYYFWSILISTAIVLDAVIVSILVKYYDNRM